MRSIAARAGPAQRRIVAVAGDLIAVCRLGRTEHVDIGDVRGDESATVSTRSAQVRSPHPVSPAEVTPYTTGNAFAASSNTSPPESPWHGRASPSMLSVGCSLPPTILGSLVRYAGDTNVVGWAERSDAQHRRMRWGSQAHPNLRPLIGSRPKRSIISTCSSRSSSSLRGDVLVQGQARVDIGQVIVWG